jgi:hypothetical protein
MFRLGFYPSGRTTSSALEGAKRFNEWASNLIPSETTDK